MCSETELEKLIRDPQKLKRMQYLHFNVDPLGGLPEFSFGPSWNFETQLYLWDRMKETLSLKDSDVNSVQVNIGIPQNIWERCPTREFLYDARTLMLAVALAFVSDRRMENKKTNKVANIDNAADAIEGKRYVRIEYGFGDIENLYAIGLVLQHMHAALVEYHKIYQPKKYDTFTSDPAFPLAAAWQAIGLNELKPFLQGYFLEQGKVNLGKARTYQRLISWRDRYPHLIDELRSILFSGLASCQQVVSNRKQSALDFPVAAQQGESIRACSSSAITKKDLLYSSAVVILLVWSTFFSHSVYPLLAVGAGLVLIGFWAGWQLNNKKKDTSVSALLHTGAQDPYDPEFIYRSLKELKQHTLLRKHKRYIGRGVAIFGGAQVEEGSSDYEDAVNLAKMINCPIVTGGGPGIMEAANKGARESSENRKQWRKSPLA
jgi:hypothetical protein